MSNIVESVANIADIVFTNQGIKHPTLDDVEKSLGSIVLMVNTMLKGSHDILSKEQIKNIILTHINIYQPVSTSIHDSVCEDWLTDFLKNSALPRKFWIDYKRNLRLPSAAIGELDRSTDEILNYLANPNTPGAWYRSGLVVGHVQSGKTGNFIGLINKAFDAGYRLILVLTGMYSDLRRQTQMRIDECVIGKDTEKKERPSIGVGKWTSHPNVISLTSANMDGDFRMDKADITGVIHSSAPTIMVCKKNCSVLDNILRFFAQSHQVGDDNLPIVADLPLLIIDDEADSAGVNSQYTKEEITRINKQIRAILSLFSQKAYVGYTATPYANIFIDPYQEKFSSKEIFYEDNGIKYRLTKDDLFPKDFIVNLTAPSNYIGPNILFGIGPSYEEYEGVELPVISLITDGFDSRKQTAAPSKVDDLPLSLIEAIKAFFISTAIRRSRGQYEHSSMLVNVSQYTIWQDCIASIIQNEVVPEICDNIEFLSDNFTAEEEFKNIFENLFVKANKVIKRIYPNWKNDLPLPTWSDVRQELVKVAIEVRHNVFAINSANNDVELNKGKLPYKEYKEKGKPLYAIAVGGNKMSRGLTLEGLTISYFFRSSNTYDTLMQMGRWFGYRDGYIDTCRIYMEEGMKTNFHNIAVATQRMREDFDELSSQKISPIDYGLKVMTFPGRLEVTARGKFGSTVKGMLSLTKSTVQAYQIYKNDKIRKDNDKVIADFLALLQKQKPCQHVVRKGEILSHVSWNASFDQVIYFLENFKTATTQAPSKLLVKYIQKEVANSGNLVDWKIVLVNGKGKPVSINVDGTKIEYNRIKRREVAKGDDIYTVQNAAVIGPSYESFDLTDEEYDKAMKKTIKEWETGEKKDKKPTSPYAKYSKESRPSKRGLLLLCNIDFGNNDKKDIFTFTLSMPQIINPQNVSYEYRGQKKAFSGIEEPVYEIED